MPLRLLLPLFLLLSLRSNAQLLDSIALFTEEPPRWIAKLDIRGSFISNQNVRIMGAKLGLEHARRFQYGIGYSFLLTPIEQEREVPGVGLVNTRLRLGYITPYVDYAFYQRGPWEVRIPVQLGLGAGSVIYKDTEGRKQKLVRTGLIIYEPAMVVQYRFLKYFGLAGGWGYRLAIRTQAQLGEQLTAPVYIFGLRIFFDDLYRDLDPND